jgi:hypothetical protein
VPLAGVFDDAPHFPIGEVELLLDEQALVDRLELLVDPLERTPRRR